MILLIRLHSIVLLYQLRKKIQPDGKENKLIGGKWFKFLHNSIRTRSGFSFGNFLLLYFPVDTAAENGQENLSEKGGDAGGEVVGSAPIRNH